MKAIPSMTQALFMYRLIVAAFGRPSFNNKRKTGRVLKWYRLPLNTSKRVFKRLVAAGLDESFVSLDAHTDVGYGLSYRCLNLTVPLEFVPSAVDVDAPLPVKTDKVQVRTKTGAVAAPDRSVEADAQRFCRLLSALEKNESWALNAVDSVWMSPNHGDGIKLIKAIDKKLSKRKMSS